MKEGDFSSGYGGGEKETLLQQQLTTRIVQASENLSKRCGEGKTWHVVSPEFGRPPFISSDENDFSGELFAMSRKTEDLLVSLTIVPEELDDEGNRLPSLYLWEISPSGAFIDNKKLTSKCHQDRCLPGFGLKVFCPKLTQEETSVDSDDRESGSTYINIDGLFWFEGAEPSSGNGSQKNGFLDRTASLETVLWILESLYTAEEIHAEEESFKL